MAVFYHGSSVLFDSFDLSHSYEGAGRAKFGYGIYLTEEFNTAAHYAFSEKRPDNLDFYVYTAEIPDRTNDNCLPLYKKVPVPATSSPGRRRNLALHFRRRRKPKEYLSGSISQTI